MRSFAATPSGKVISSDFLIPRKMGETAGEGTGPTETGIPVGRVPPPGESGSANYRAVPIPKLGIRKYFPGKSTVEDHRRTQR